MHVVYVFKSFPVLSQVFALNEMKALQEMGVQITIISLLPPREGIRHALAEEMRGQVIYWWEARRRKPTVLLSNLKALGRSGWEGYRKARQMVEEIGLLKGARAFARLTDLAIYLRERGVHHLHAHFATEATTVAQVLSILSGLPFSFTAHAFDIFLTPHRLGEKMQAARFVATVSEYNKRYLLQHWPGTPADKIHTIRPAVDLKRFPPDSRIPTGDGRFRIFSVGRLVEKKGLADLITACKLLAERGLDFECTIVGEGPQRTVLEALVARYGLEDRVHLPGAMAQEHFLPMLRRADVFALPCVIARNGDRDAMPLAIVEAMAMGLPVVSIRIVGIPELVQEGTGLLVPPHSPSDLARALEQLYQAGPEGRAAMGAKGRAVVKRYFDARREARKLLALFRGESGSQPDPRNEGGRKG